MLKQLGCGSIITKGENDFSTRSPKILCAKNAVDLGARLFPLLMKDRDHLKNADSAKGMDG